MNIPALRITSRHTLASLLAVASACFLAGCSEPPDAATPRPDPAAVARFETKALVPLCNQSRFGSVYYVSSEDQFYFCDGRALQALDVIGEPGADGLSWLVELADAGADQCVEGGMVIHVGPDANGDGTLGAAELRASRALCSGANGAPGPRGESGAEGTSSLLAQSTEPDGENCAHGGTRIDTGLDENRNGVLDPEEVGATTFVCNGGTFSDECPDDPGKTEPGVCGCGTPDVDGDQDGALDCQEACPSDPAKTAAGACGCGQPDTLPGQAAVTVAFPSSVPGAMSYSIVAESGVQTVTGTALASGEPSMLILGYGVWRFTAVALDPEGFALAHAVAEDVAVCPNGTQLLLPDWSPGPPPTCTTEQVAGRLAALFASPPPTACLPRTTFQVAGVDAVACAGSCANGTPGCDVSIDWRTVDWTLTAANTGDLAVDADLAVEVPMEFFAPFGVVIRCTLNASVSAARVSATLELAPSQVTLQRMEFDVGDIALSGCSGLGDIATPFAATYGEPIVGQLANTFAETLSEMNFVCSE